MGRFHCGKDSSGAALGKAQLGGLLRAWRLLPVLRAQCDVQIQVQSVPILPFFMLVFCRCEKLAATLQSWCRNTSPP